MKKVYIIISFLFLLLVVIPLSINGLVSSGFFGIKIFVTEFSNQSWFEFWYTYLPAIIAFSGTLYAVNQANRQNKRLQEFEEKNFAFNVMPEVKLRLSGANIFKKEIDKPLPDIVDQYESEYDDVQRMVREIIDEIVLKLEELNDEKYKNTLFHLKESLNNEEIATAPNYIHNSQARDLIKNTSVVELWDQAKDILSELDSKKKNFTPYKLLNGLWLENKRYVINSNIRSFAVLVVDTKWNYKEVTDIYYHSLNFVVENISSTDITDVFIDYIEVENETDESIVYRIEEWLDYVIPQQRSKDTRLEGNLQNKVYFHLYNSSTFLKEMDLKITINYKFRTALNYEYVAKNIITYNKRDAVYLKESHSNSIPYVTQRKVW